MGLLSAEEDDEERVTFASLGLVGWGFRNDPNLLRILTGLANASAGAAFSVETSDVPELALGFSTRYESWMTDWNPAEGTQWLIAGTLSLANFARSAVPLLVRACPVGRPAVADLDELDHILGCVLLERVMWTIARSQGETR